LIFVRGEEKGVSLPHNFLGRVPPREKGRRKYCLDEKRGDGSSSMKEKNGGYVFKIA